MTGLIVHDMFHNNPDGVLVLQQTIQDLILVKINHEAKTFDLGLAQRGDAL